MADSPKRSFPPCISTYDDGDDLIEAGSDGFTYDYGNRLVTASVSGHDAEYAYDGDGVRVGADVDSSSSELLVTGSPDCRPSLTTARPPICKPAV